MLRLLVDSTTPWNSKVPIEQLDQRAVPSVVNLGQLQKMFAQIRDLRAWQWGSRAGFARRIPWLYVDDGCFLRAEMVVELTGTEAPIVYHDLPVDDPKVRQPDITKARTQLGWEPQVTLREGLVRTIEYFDGVLQAHRA